MEEEEELVVANQNDPPSPEEEDEDEEPIDNGFLTPEQATRMISLPCADMKEIMNHFELCDNAGEPICWNLIAEIVTSDGETPAPPGKPDDEDDEDDDGCAANDWWHGYGYCLECGRPSFASMHDH